MHQNNVNYYSMLASDVRDHAYENYETDGWDMIYECYSAEELFKVISEKDFTSKKEAIEHFHQIALLYDEQRRSVQNEIF